MGQLPGTIESKQFEKSERGWVNITGMVGQHETERWVSMLRNLQTDRFGIIVWSAVNVKDNNFKNGAELQGYFTKGLEKILHQYGKELLGWDEILEGGVASNATVMSWQGMTGGVEAAKLNHKVVMAPTDYCYLDYNQDNLFYKKSADGNLKLKTVYEFEICSIKKIQ